jgi:hypothetical protein
MARQDGLYFKGRMGNVVGATWKGIPYLRYMPDKINQTGATRQSGANMGRASRMGAAFRKSFEPLLPQPKDRTAQNRFTGALKKWLQTKPFEQALPATALPHISGFEFNEASPAKARFRMHVTVEVNAQQQLLLKIGSFVPEQNIVAPAYTQTVNIKIAAASCHVDACTIAASYFEELSFPYNNDAIPSQTMSLPLQAEEKCVSLVLLALRYHTSKGVVEDLRWWPCGIVAGCFKY